MIWPYAALSILVYLLIGGLAASMTVRYKGLVFHAYDEQVDVILCILLWPFALASIVIVYGVIFVCWPIAALAVQIIKRVPRK